MKLIALLTLFFSFYSYSSALVCKVDNDLIIRSHLIFYGSKAELDARNCALEINDHFTRPEVQVVINNKKYNVKFEFSYQITSYSTALKSSTLNKSIENNYIRIEEKALSNKHGRSNNILGGNVGFYASKDKLGTSTTCPHEYGHSLGLKHYDKRGDNYKGYGHKGSLKGTKGAPGIMAARGFLVNSQYQRNPEAKYGESGYTIHPKHRVVRKEDIKDLKLEKLTFDKNNCATLGKVRNYVYNNEGIGVKSTANEFDLFESHLEISIFSNRIFL